MRSLDAIIRAADHGVAMASLVIRNLDDGVAARLRLQARLRGVSVQQEARRVLTEGTSVARGEIAARARAIRQRQARHRSRAVDLVRADRAR